VTIAATGHRTPTPAAGARGIIEQEAAGWVGADAKTGARALRNDLRGGPGDGRQEPVQTAFTGYESEAPLAILFQEFVVTFGDAQDFVDRFDPFANQRFFLEQDAETFTKGSVKPLGFAK
jgi:hypothetical protein